MLKEKNFAIVRGDSNATNATKMEMMFSFKIQFGHAGQNDVRCST